MAATIQIDQTGLPAGTAGRARTDGLSTGAEVTLTNTSPTASTTVFRLLWVPPGDTTALSSLSEDSPNVWTFTPTAGVYGTYLVELVENEGSSAERRERRVFGVRLPNSKLLIPALNEVADPTATISTQVDSQQTENSDDNALDYVNPDLNVLPFAGWWRKFYELFLAVESGGVGAPSYVVQAYNTGPVTISAANINANEITVFLTGGGITVNIPDASTVNTGARILVKDGGFALASPHTIVPAAGSIDGVASKLLANNQASLTLQSNGANWMVIS